MATILKGAFDVSLGGFPCIRGYAKLGDLFKISKPDKEFQRDLITTHKAEIKNFLEDRDYLFFPEIILSCSLKYDFTKKGAISGLNPIKNILSKVNFKSNVDNLAIRFFYNSVAEIRLDESKTHLTRVDGNHRLSAAELNEAFKDYTTPFCIIIFPDGDTKKEKVIFHNINFRSIPLEFEQSLKVILEDRALFPDEELKKARLGWDFYFGRKILNKLSCGLGQKIPALTVADGNKYRSVIVKTIKFLLDKKVIEKDDKQIEIIENAITDLNGLYLKTPMLSSNKNAGIFSTLVYYVIKKPLLLTSLLNWIISDKLYEIKEITDESLVTIFEKALEAKSKNIFISTSFNDSASKTNYKSIEQTINEINLEFKDANLKLKLIKIDKTDNPCTFQISDEILEKIENSGLFIADLSGRNHNVYHEIGYAMGYIKGKALENKVILIMRKARRNTDRRVAFNLRGFSQIRFSRTKPLREELKEKIKKFYSLK